MYTLLTIIYFCIVIPTLWSEFRNPKTNRFRWCLNLVFWMWLGYVVPWLGVVVICIIGGSGLCLIAFGIYKAITGYTPAVNSEKINAEFLKEWKRKA